MVPVEELVGTDEDVAELVGLDVDNDVFEVVGFELLLGIDFELDGSLLEVGFVVVTLGSVVESLEEVRFLFPPPVLKQLVSNKVENNKTVKLFFILTPIQRHQYKAGSNILS